MRSPPQPPAHPLDSRRPPAGSAAALLAFAAMLAGVPATAQRPAPWVELTASAPINLAMVQQLGKVVVYRDGGNMHVFSAFARRWASVPASGAATVRLANDWALVVDGNTWHAFSAWRGAFATLRLGAGAAVLNPATQRNDSLLLVQDGSDLWAFSGFTGTWTRRTLASTPLFAVQRHTAVLVDGGRVHGMSAFGGGWITGPSVPTPGPLRADGTVGIVEDQGRWHGFSALRRTWQTEAALGPVTHWQVDDDLVVWADGVRCVGFSGLRGAFTTAVTGPVQSIDTNERVAVVTTPAAVHLYSPVLDTWAQLPALSPPSGITVESDLALLGDASALHAYSPHTGTLATLAGRQSAWGAANAIGVAQDAQGAVQLYSALTGAWQAAPAGTTTLPLRAGNAALLQTATGWAAFSCRGGRIVPLAAPTAGPLATPHVDPESSILAVEDAQQLHVFDARRGIWLSAAHAAQQPLLVHIWRTTLVAWDGTQVFGFGVQDGELATRPLTGPLLDLNANSESGRAAAGNRLLGFAAVGDLQSLWQLPEFRRTYVRGAELEVQLAATPGALAGGVIAAAPLAVPHVIPGLGTLLVDPTVLLPLPLGPIDNDGRAFARFVVPEHPVLAGFELFLQGVVVPPAGSAYLTGLGAVMLR